MKTTPSSPLTVSVWSSNEKLGTGYRLIKIISCDGQKCTCLNSIDQKFRISTSELKVMDIPSYTGCSIDEETGYLCGTITTNGATTTVMLIPWAKYVKPVRKKRSSAAKQDAKKKPKKDNKLLSLFGSIDLF